MYNWTKTIYKKATEVFKNRENLENIKKIEKFIKMAISHPYGLQTKIWGHFLFSNFKSWSKESAFIFWICGLWAEILPFCHFINIIDLEPNQENEKMAISQPRGHKSKKWGHFIFLNERKCPRIFVWRPYGWDIPIMSFY